MKTWMKPMLLLSIFFFMKEDVLAVSFSVPSMDVVIPSEFRSFPSNRSPSLEKKSATTDDPFFNVESNQPEDDLFLTLIFAKGRLGFGTTDPSQILLREFAKDSNGNLAKFTLKVPSSGFVHFQPIEFSIRPINKKDPQVQRFGLSTNAFNLVVLVLHHGPIFTWKNTIAGQQSVYNTLPAWEVDRGFYRWTKVQIIPFSILMTMMEKLQTAQMNNLQANPSLRIQIQEDLLYQGPE